MIAKEFNKKIRIIYQSPNTDEPNKLFVSIPYTLHELFFNETQIDFENGGYLMIKELEPEYTKFI